jgi:hypothetical protein
MSDIMRGLIIVNIKSMDYLPLMERWLLRDHAAEFVGSVGHSLARYVSHRAVPAPPDAMTYGYYNWRVTEVWMRGSPGGGGGQGGSMHLLSVTWPKDYEKITEHSFAAKGWNGRPNGPHPAAQCTIPVRPTNDFKGSELTLGDKNILRWYFVFKYPEGVSVEEGEDWYLNVHAKEAVQQPGLTRFFSYRVMESMPGRPPSRWHRLTEQWYESFSGWRESVIESPPKYTKPPWAKYDKYPFFEPYVDFVSTFILEKPTNDFLRDDLSYIPDCC